jgi:hypothetical protein
MLDSKANPSSSTMNSFFRNDISSYYINHDVQIRRWGKGGGGYIRYGLGTVPLNALHSLHYQPYDVVSRRPTNTDRPRPRCNTTALELHFNFLEIYDNDNVSMTHSKN